MIIAKFLALIIIGYLLGSIPFGLIVSRKVAKKDVREYGSGKIGTTNVLRTAGKKAAALVAFLDILKGAIAVLVAGLMFGLVAGETESVRLLRTAQVMTALAAMAGHNWSIFLKFKGGRGVATFFGGLMALNPVAALVGGELAVTGAVLTRFASLASLTGAVGTYAILIPLTINSGFPIEYLAYTLVGTIAIFISHRDNITRLLAGKERRLGEKAAVKVEASSSHKRTG